MFGTGPVIAHDASAAAKELGRTVMVGGVDLSTDILKDIAAGDVAFTIDQQQYLQGYLSVLAVPERHQPEHPRWRSADQHRTWLRRQVQRRRGGGTGHAGHPLSPIRYRRWRALQGARHTTRRPKSTLHVYFGRRLYIRTSYEYELWGQGDP